MTNLHSSSALVDWVNTLNREQKWKIYFHYLVKTIALKHDFYAIDAYQHSGKPPVGWGQPDKTIGQILIYKSNKNIHAYQFEEFFHHDRIEKREYEGRSWIQLSAGYDWALKFYNEIFGQQSPSQR